MKKIYPFVMLAVGAFFGVAARLLDIYTKNLGNIFSEMSIWILICVWITLKANSRAAACVRVFMFCTGMLVAYYITAELTHGYYYMQFITGWSVFTLLTPLMACVIFCVKNKGISAKIISVITIAVTLLLAKIVFNGPRIYDWIIVIVLAYTMLIKPQKEENLQ